MSYTLSFSESPAESVERVRREQLDAAADGLDEHGEDPVEAVHDARKRLKKTRSLLRLARPAMKTKAYRKRNRALRDAGRSLSGARDADVMAETVEDLAERFAGQAPKTLFSAAHAPLAARARASRSATDPGDAASRLRSLAGEPWPVRDLKAKVLRASLKRTYKRGRDAFELADREPTAEHLHEWRKRVKDLWYQQRLLEETWPGVQKAQAKEARKLSKLLGTDHDLAVLADQLRNDPALTEAPETDPDLLLGLIATRREELLERIRELGRRVYAERPKAFARRQGRYVDLAAR